MKKKTKKTGEKNNIKKLIKKKVYDTKGNYFGTIESIESIYSEVRSLIEGGQEEIKIEKQVAFDKTTQQFSIKIPKNIVLKSGLDKMSMLSIVFNPKKQETKDEINNSKLVIYLKNEKTNVSKGDTQNKL